MNAIAANIKIDFFIIAPNFIIAFFSKRVKLLRWRNSILREREFSKKISSNFF